MKNPLNNDRKQFWLCGVPDTQWYPWYFHVFCTCTLGNRFARKKTRLASNRECKFGISTLQPACLYFSNLSKYIPFKQNISTKSKLYCRCESTDWKATDNLENSRAANKITAEKLYGTRAGCYLKNSREAVWNTAEKLYGTRAGCYLKNSMEAVWNTAEKLYGTQAGCYLKNSREAVWNTAGKLYGIQQGSCMEFSRDAVWNTGSCLENNWSADWNTAEKLCGTQTAA